MINENETKKCSYANSTLENKIHNNYDIHGIKLKKSWHLLKALCTHTYILSTNMQIHHNKTLAIFILLHS